MLIQTLLFIGVWFALAVATGLLFGRIAAEQKGDAWED